MTQLGTIASLMRSKNAGPFELTIDIMFDGPADFERVIASGVVNDKDIGALLGIEPQLVKVHHYPPAHAIKVTMPRPVSVGDPGDSDLFGGQLFGPLVTLDIPD